jgi:hypothetical protein
MPSYNGVDIPDQSIYRAVKSWVGRRCPSARTELTYRFQDTYPLTFCRFWAKPDLRIVVYGKTESDDELYDVDDFIAVDAHYNKNTGNFQAIGGMWINRVKQFAVKPQQEWMDRIASWESVDVEDLYRNLRDTFPNKAPAPITLRNYSTISEFLHDNVKRVF